MLPAPSKSILIYFNLLHFLFRMCNGGNIGPQTIPVLFQIHNCGSEGCSTKKNLIPTHNIP